jgi:hypothetical protein
MDYFTLGLLPNIDFNKRAQQQHNGNGLRAKGSAQYLLKYTLYDLKNSTPISINNTCLGLEDLKRVCL